MELGAQYSGVGWLAGWGFFVLFCSFLKAVGTIASKCSLSDRAKLFPYTSYYYWQLLSVNRNFFPPSILLQNNNSAKKQINNGDLLVRVGGKSTATISWICICFRSLFKNLFSQYQKVMCILRVDMYSDNHKS